MPAWLFFLLSYVLLDLRHSGTFCHHSMGSGTSTFKSDVGTRLVDLFGIAAHPSLLPLSWFWKLVNRGIKIGGGPQRVSFVVVLPLSLYFLV